MENLLPPIVSRLHRIYFSRIGKNEISEFLVRNIKIGKEKAMEISDNSYGRPGMALNLASGKEQLTIKIKIEAEKFLKSSGFARSQIIKSLIEEQKEKPEVLDKFFEFLIINLRKDPVANCQVIKSLLNRLFFIKSYNVNKRIQIEAIL